LEQATRAIELGTSTDQFGAHVGNDPAKAIPVLEVAVALDRSAPSLAEVPGCDSSGRDVGRARRRIERVAERRDVRLPAPVDGRHPADASSFEESLLLLRKPNAHDRSSVQDGGPRGLPSPPTRVTPSLYTVDPPIRGAAPHYTFLIFTDQEDALS